MLIERNIGWAFNGLTAVALFPAAHSAWQGQSVSYGIAAGLSLVSAPLGILFSTAVSGSHESPSARWVGFVFFGLLALAFVFGQCLCAWQIAHPVLRVLGLIAASGPALVWGGLIGAYLRKPG